MLRRNQRLNEKVEIQFGQMQCTTAQINSQRNCLPNDQDHSPLYERSANQPTNSRSHLHGSPSTQSSTSHTLCLIWYLHLNNSCRNPTIELLILLIKPRCQKDGEQQLQWGQMMAHSLGYPTDIDRWPDREERSREKQSSSMTWQLRRRSEPLLMQAQLVY